MFSYASCWKTPVPFPSASFEAGVPLRFDHHVHIFGTVLLDISVVYNLRYLVGESF